MPFTYHDGVAARASVVVRPGSGGTAVDTRVTIDRQGRIVVPLAERRRLGLEGGEELVIVPTPEGLLLERRREATVRTGPHGLPVVEFAEPRPVSAAEALAALHAHRDER